MNDVEQLGFKGRGWPRKLTEREIEQRRQAGHAAAAKAGSKGMSQRGRKGYEVSTERLGQWEFHNAGGRQTTKLYLYTNPTTGAVGYDEAVKAGVWQPKGKKHRYNGKGV